MKIVTFIKIKIKKRQCQGTYLVGLLEGTQRTQMTTRRKNARRVQKAGIIQEICQSSLNGSLALKYS